MSASETSAALTPLVFAGSCILTVGALTTLLEAVSGNLRSEKKKSVNHKSLHNTRNSAIYTNIGIGNGKFEGHTLGN